MTSVRRESRQHAAERAIDLVVAVVTAIPDAPDPADHHIPHRTVQAREDPAIQNPVAFRRVQIGIVAVQDQEIRRGADGDAVGIPSERLRATLAG